MFKFCIPFYRSHKRKPVYRPSLKAANSSVKSVRWTDKGTQISINSWSVWAWKGWELKQNDSSDTVLHRELTQERDSAHSTHCFYEGKLSGLRLYQIFLFKLSCGLQVASILAASDNLLGFRQLCLFPIFTFSWLIILSSCVVEWRGNAANLLYLKLDFYCMACQSTKCTVRQSVLTFKNPKLS